MGEIFLIGICAYFDLSAVNNNYLQNAFDRPDWTTWHSLPVSMAYFATAIICPMLFLRWRYPWIVFIVFWATNISSYFLWGIGTTNFTIFVALYPLARRGTSRVALIALILQLVPTITMLFVDYVLVPHPYLSETFEEKVLFFLESVVISTFFVILIWGVGRLMYNAEIRGEQDRKQQTAAAVRAERLYLARELHDIVSHSVSAMILQAAGAKTLASAENGQVKAALEVIETTGIEAMVELHRLLGLLRAADPMDDRDETSAPASLQDLEALVSSTRASGVDVEVMVEGHPAELDRSVGLTAYRIVQEALTNTIKHAGRGASALVHLRWDSAYLRLTIRDRTGFGAQERAELSSGHGLAGLTERVILVGGTMEAGPVADGFLVRAQLPIHPSTPQQSPPPTYRKDMA